MSRLGATRLAATVAVPLLRSPPFPWVKAAEAAVSQPTSAIGEMADAFALARIGRARVGGTFWAPPAPERRPVLLRADDEPTFRSLLTSVRRDGHAERNVLAVLPRGLTSPGPIAAVFDPVDPWSLLRPGVLLYADADHEWSLLAQLAGAELATPGSADAAATALAAAAYRDPFTGAAAPLGRAIDILAQWRESLDLNRGIGVAVGISWWKRDAIGRMLWDGSDPLPFAETSADAMRVVAGSSATIAGWPSRLPADLQARAAHAGSDVVQVEDGFIRSAGLGANLLPPQSIVLDRRGIYYDPGQSSDLEALLEHGAFPPDLLARAAALRTFIVARGISKYASGSAGALLPRRDGHRRVLVTGQVEDDLSVRRAGAGVAGNLDLLRRARAAEPDAYLLFKPHPDVDAGHRIGGVPDAEALAHADEVTRAPIDALLAQVDAVHVLSSLTGFEALLRGLDVTVHGQPFYAGWGLTTDLAPPIARRTARRTLDELVAAVLILYPRYLDPVTSLPCPPEVLLERMAAGQMPRPSLLVRARALQGRLARLLGRPTTRNRA